RHRRLPAACSFRSSASRAYRHAPTQGSGEILNGQRKLDAAKRLLFQKILGRLLFHFKPTCDVALRHWRQTLKTSAYQGIALQKSFCSMGHKFSELWARFIE